MTKSTITREESVQAVFDLKVGYRLGFADLEILKRVARMALAAMDSKPVAEITEDLGRLFVKIHHPTTLKAGDKLYRHAQPAPTCEPITVTDDMAYAFHHALTDSMIGADDVEEIKTGLRAVFANLTAPVVSAKCPERLPCSVLLEPGLRFGKGIKTSTVLAALARRAVYESDMAALSPEEKAEFRQKIADFKALIAQPAPVVSEDLYKLANHIASSKSGLPDEWLDWAEELETDIRRAAVLQAGNSPVQSESRCSTKAAPAPDSLPKTAVSRCGNPPVIPDGYRLQPISEYEAMCATVNSDEWPQRWIPVSEQMPGSQEWVIVFAKWANQQVLCWDDVQNRWTDFEDQSYYADMFSHWMPLPAAPQEARGDINALIPLVSRNEREVK